MEFSDDDSVGKGHRTSHTANLRGGTPVANTRADKNTNVPGRKSKETGTERQREKTRPNTEKDDENVEKISDNKVKNLQPGEGKNHRNESAKKMYPLKTLHKIYSLLDRLSVVIASIAVAVALYTQFFSLPFSKPDKPLKDVLEDIHKLQKLTKALSTRLSSVESRLPDIKQFTDRTSVEESLELENRVRKTESELSGEVNANNEELKVLKDEVQKLKDQIDVRFGDIKIMQKKHKELQAEVINLKEKLLERSQVVENRNAEVSNQMFQHNETLRDLNLYVENLTSTLSNLNAYVEHRVITNVTDMLGKITANNMETEVLKDKVQKLKDGLQTNMTTLERKLGEQSQSAGNKNAEMIKQISHHSETLNGLIASVENLDSSLRSLDVSVKIHGTNLRSLNDSVENFGSNLRSLNVSAESHGSSLRSLNVSVGNFGSSLHSLNVSVENLGSSLHSLNVSAENLGSSLLSLNVFVENLDSSLRSLNVSVENHGCNISGLNVFVDSLRSNVKHLTENITRIYIETLVLDKRTEHIVDNIFDKGSLIVVIMINTTLLVIVIIYLVASRKTTRYPSGIVDNEQQLNPAPYSTAGRILSQVRANSRLQRKLCVISFYEETHPLHMRMTQSVTQQLNQELVEFIIRRHEDILECPPVSLYFLFVDFNERNVILEDPTLGLGDLRLTTVQAVQKMGGKIVIFYVRDPNSRQLNPTKLYNGDLASVTKQRDLSALNRLSRFISAYAELTDNQKAHLRQIVVHELNSR